jgi:hypothetical protein
VIFSVGGYVGAALAFAKFAAVIVGEQAEVCKLGRRPAESLIEGDVLWR